MELKKKKGNTKNLKAWVAALRSGQYKQTKGQLHDGKDGYCCLGVVCKLMDLPMVEVTNNPTKPLYYFGHGHDKSWSILPVEAQQWLGVEISDPTLYYDIMNQFRITHASVLNDDREFTFNDIADAIERTYDLTESPTEE